MARRARWKLAAVSAAVIAAAVAGISVTSREAEAHGATQVPASRVYSCRFEQPDNPMCAGAWSAGSQALYDWMEVNLPDADGQHQQRIPDGELCSAGRDKYAAFDRPGDWPLTNLQANSSGQYEVIYTNTAPHATAYYRLYLSRAGFDARTDTLRWADLEQVYDSGPLAAAQQNRFTVSLPARIEPAILYVVWQRSDSPEAFYSCSDVTIGGTGSAPPPTVPPPSEPPVTAPPGTTTPPSTAPAPTPPPPAAPGTAPQPSQPTTTSAGGRPSPAPPPASSGNPFSPVAGIHTAATRTADWDGGYCADIRVENASSSSARTWEVHYEPGGEIASLWNATGEEQDHAGHEGHIAFVGEDWNQRIAPGQWTTFGMCVDEE
jgi:predicted carbohydrate-binding protein with CBM5 and CBM33 domain